MDVDFSDNSLTRTKVFGGDDVKFNKLSLNLNNLEWIN